MKTVIRLDKVSKSYTLGEKKITALKEFSFEVKSGEFDGSDGTKRIREIYFS